MNLARSVGTTDFADFTDAEEIVPEPTFAWWLSRNDTEGKSGVSREGREEREADSNVSQSNPASVQIVSIPHGFLDLLR